MLTFTLTPHHGWVMAVAVSSTLFITYLGGKVGMQRKKADMPYPHMYATREECEKDPKKSLFNCYQRAHQNTLEGYPIYLLLLGLSGVFYPRAAAICGGIWLVGRYFFAQGYYTGVPAKRMRGGFSYLGLLPMLFMSAYGAWTLINAA